ncbi:MAG: hypothetical protein R2762_04795 [Bryobacteraceae bacterium]
MKRTVLALGFSLLPVLAGVPAAAAADSSPDAFGKVPIYFEENTGQVAPEVRFIGRLGASTVYLTADGSFTVLRRSRGASAGGYEEAVVQTRLVGAATGDARGLDPMSGVSHYYIGDDPTKWRTSVPHFGRVRMENVYPGVDLVYYPGQGSLEYDFVVGPGADPSHIRLEIKGAKDLRVAVNGDLQVSTALGNIYHRRPSVYQTVEGRKVPVAANYRMKDGIVGFELGGYRRDLPLVIDPIIDYSTYLGGSGADAAAAVIHFGTNAYVAGTTGSTNFPPGGTRSGTSDVFVAKMDPTGAALAWAIYLGGSADETGRAITRSGLDLYVAGATQSTNFPGTAGAFQAAKRGFDDGFVTRLNSTTGAIIRTTYYGGNGQDFGLGLAVDSTDGTVVLVGQTGSPDLTLQSPVDASLSGLTDGFIARFNSSLQALTFATYVGGSGLDEVRSAAIRGGIMAFAGVTSGGLTTVSPLQASFGGGSTDGLFGRINLSTLALQTLSYFGGTSNDEISAVAMDGSDGAYLAGRTLSSPFPHTTPGSINQAHKGGFDIVAAKITGTSTLSYGALLGGSGDDLGLAIAVDTSNRAVIGGSSTSAGFPTYNANQPALRGLRDAVVFKLNAAGSALIHSTFFGGLGVESAQGVFVASTGESYVVGSTDSTDLPVVSAFDTSANGSLDGFAARFSDGPPPIPVTFTTNPAGRQVLVDGAVYTTPVTLGWAIGVSHSVTAINPQFQAPDQTFSWLSWDSPLIGGAQTQTVVTPGGATTYNANFSVQTCTYSVSPNPASIGLGGGTLNFNVTTGGTCPWVATPNNTWITGGGSIQTGSGTASLNVAANAFARIGSATVAFQDITVNQVTSNTPIVLEPSPAFGSGASRVFTFSFEDPNGAADLDVLNVIVNNAIDGRVSCYLAYVPSGPTTGTVFLVNDAGDAGGPFAGSLAIPSSGTIGNSQCNISGSGSSASMSGNRLTLLLNMSFAAGFGGNKVVYQAARDKAANNSGWVAKGVWNIPGAPATSPSVVSLSPQRVVGAGVTLTAVLSDTDGFADLNIINILINNAIDGRVGCYLAFVRPTGQLLLVNDAGEAGGPFAGGMTIPGSGSVSNSQCTINGAGSSVSGSGNNLTLTLNFSFSSGFSGDRIVFVAPRDVAENNPGWQPMGTISVP